MRGRYPTILEDRNGNQVLVRYNTGLGAAYANSRARITEIEDTRAVANAQGIDRHTFDFVYSPYSW